MQNMIENSVGEPSGHISGGNPWWATTVAYMYPLTTVVHREQSEGMSDTRDLMRTMIAELHKRQVKGTTLHVDIVGAGIRPGDLSAKFDPRMDQPINLFTGRGDEMVIIV